MRLQNHYFNIQSEHKRLCELNRQQFTANAFSPDGNTDEFVFTPADLSNPQGPREEANPFTVALCKEQSATLLDPFTIGFDDFAGDNTISLSYTSNTKGMIVEE